MLHHVRRGSGPPLVLIHPLGAELVVWEPVLDSLARERDVIAVDLPGFGLSPPDSNGVPPTPRGLAASVIGLLDDLGVGDVHVAGNSLGGWVALELAKGGRTLSVAGLCSAGFWRRPLGPKPGGDVRRVGRSLLPVMSLLLRSERGRRVLLRGSVARPERVPPRAAERLVRSYVTSPGFDGANAAMRAEVFSGVDRIRVPVTLAWAEHDRIVQRPRSSVPGWGSVTLRGCGHIPTWDDPAQVTRVLLAAST